MTSAPHQFWVHNLNPIILQLGPLAVRWYGVMYIVGFALAYWLLTRRRNAGLLDLRDAHSVQDMLFYGFCGVLIGGRLGHCLFYEPAMLLTRPWEIVMVWTGGMSSHGGFAGVLIAFALFARRHRVSFLHVLDNGVLAATPGLFFGRLGNFINGELCGTVTTVPWAVIFPEVDQQPRHPVQLYQAFTEGAVIFAVLMVIGRKRRPEGLLAGVFGIAYSCLRMLTEPYRARSIELAGPLGLTQGQFLSLFSLALSVYLFVRALLKRPAASAE